MKAEFIEVTPRTGLAIGCSMLVAGLLFVTLKFHRIAEELRSLRWPSAIGIVESLNFHTSASSSRNRTTTIHHGEFSYRYTVNNREYIGHRYDSKGSMQTGLGNEAAKVEAQTKSSPAVKVFYDPDEPSQSMLKKGISEDTWVRFTFSSFLLILGIIVSSYQWKRLKAESDPNE